MHNFKPPVYKGLQMTLSRKRFKGVDYNKQFWRIHEIDNSSLPDYEIKYSLLFWVSISSKICSPNGFKHLNHLNNCKLLQKLSYQKQVNLNFIWLMMTKTTNTRESKLALTYYLGHDPSLAWPSFNINSWHVRFLQNYKSFW